MSEDNGKSHYEPTDNGGPEPEAKTKAELFAENPDRFIDSAECPLLVIRDIESGQLKNISINCDIDESFIIEGRMAEAFRAYRAALRQKMAKTGLSVVKKNGNGFLGGLRRMRK